jgi:tetratricopeptide (TPR) repeat protein
MSSKPLLIALALILFAGCQSAPKPSPEPATAETTQQAAPVEVEKDPAGDLYKLALQSAKADKIKKATAQFEQLLELDARYPRAHTNLGLIFFRQNKLEPAKEHFLTAIEQDKQDAIAYNHLAIIKRRQGAFDEAAALYQKAIDADSEYANAHLNLGILLDIYLQRLPEALAQYREYQELSESANEDVDKWIADIERRIKKSGN